MGRFAESNPLLDAVVDVIAERAADFDREVIEDLIQAVGEDDIWLACVGPAIDAVMGRIGLAKFIESSGDKPEVAVAIDPAGEPEGTIAMAMCTCPHCNSQFAATLEQIAKGEKDHCPNCGEEVIPGQHPTAGVEPEPPTTEGGP